MRIQYLTCRLISANCYLTGSNDAASTQTVTYSIILKRTDNNLFWENYLWHWGIPLLMCFRLTSTRQSKRPLCDFRPFKGMPTIGSRWFSGILPNTVLDITSVDVWTHFHPENGRNWERIMQGALNILRWSPKWKSIDWELIIEPSSPREYLKV